MKIYIRCDAWVKPMYDSDRVETYTIYGYGQFNDDFDKDVAILWFRDKIFSKLDKQFEPYIDDHISPVKMFNITMEYYYKHLSDKYVSNKDILLDKYQVYIFEVSYETDIFTTENIPIVKLIDLRTSVQKIKDKFKSWFYKLF